MNGFYRFTLPGCAHFAATGPAVLIIAGHLRFPDTPPERTPAA